ncbi:MauE/DoxX family redox-associated membrane protein [Pedobacter sp. N23S346]|uniref:MauE/DoxX family redox-associated membrane protein n=1 Tax=Pedobacter sp. N23S346 TaxID=3402750 RepID=UPI003AD434FE
MSAIRSPYYASQVISAAFILLWIYTAGSKLINFGTYRLEMQHQVFSSEISAMLIYIVPTFELLAVILLLFQKTNKIGLMLSLLLIAAFTGYICLITIGYFPKVPCSCGGVIRSLGWKGHFIFNLAFLILAIFALYIETKREASDKEY